MLIGLALPRPTLKVGASLSVAVALAASAVMLCLIFVSYSEPFDGGPSTFREALPLIAIYGLLPLLVTAFGAYMTFSEPPGRVSLWAAAIAQIIPQGILMNLTPQTQFEPIVMVWMSPGLLLLLSAVLVSRRREPAGPSLGHGKGQA